jgi:D-aspartate ligase
MRILTVYADRNSDSRFASFGEVLFEEHAPGVLGNPAAIVSSSAPELVEQAQRFLKDTGWVGYANFDLKYDPRDGKTKFFEINPRLGRSNWYVTGAGNNAPKYYVDEYVDDALGEWDGTVHQQQDETIYHIVPRFLVRRYIKDPARAAQVRRIFRRGGSRNPMLYGAERDPRRWAMIAAVQANYVRKFRRYFDPATDI